MATARRVTIGLVLLLSALPVAAMQACGSSNSASTGAGDGGEDGTTGDGSGSGSDGSSGSSGSSSSSGSGDARGDTSSDGQSDSSSGGSSGSSSGGTTCTPGCPSNVTCGRYTDCKGNVQLCGMPCPKGEVCMAGSGGAQSCQMLSCSGKCGELGVDPCGVPINCPGCPSGQTCVNNACVMQMPSDGGDAGGCSKLSCNPDPGTNLCGTVSDGCGHTMNCSCPSGQQCIGGVCQAPPPECMGADGGTGSTCGSVENACGSGKVQCGGCNGTNTCTGGVCTACTPPSCGSVTCGEVSNGCGPKVSCGTCGSSDKCYDGGCCTPITCAEAADAGLVTGCNPVDLGCGVKTVCNSCATGQHCYMDSCCTPLTCAQADASPTGCAPVDLGCGVQKVCNSCATGQTCVMDKCQTCVPKTCADFGNTGCNHDDGCGSRLDCCGSGGTVCTGDSICCVPGDVDYQGSCCKPQCDPSLPPGPQMICGQVVFCGSGSQ